MKTAEWMSHSAEITLQSQHADLHIAKMYNTQIPVRHQHDYIFHWLFSYLFIYLLDF